MDYEKALEKIQNRIEYEFNEFYNEKMSSSSRRDIFEDCFEISFYTAFNDYFDADVDTIDPKVIELLADQENPLEFLYIEYQDDDGIHLAYGQKDVEDWLNFLCERKNK